MQPALRGLRCSRPPGLRTSLGQTRLCRVNVVAEYSFADSNRNAMKGRANRGALKQQAKHIIGLVKGLCLMNPKQLKAVSHLLSNEQLQAIGIAARLPRSNQGRKRQENLVAKMLRSELDEATVTLLTEAVTLAQQQNLTFVDTEADELLQSWVEGLLSNDLEAESSVFSIAPGYGLDVQQLRVLVRQAQQQLQEQKEAAEVVPPPGSHAAAAAALAQASAGSSALGAGAMVTVQAAAAAAAPGGTRQLKQPPAKKALLKSLRPVALQHMQAQREGAED